METRNAQTSLRSYLREGKHLQLLRLQVKETCKHGSNTQAQKQRLLPSATPPGLTKVQTKTISFLRLPPKRAVEAPAPTEKKTFSSSACRSWWQNGERYIRLKMSFSPALFEERHGKGVPRGNVLARFLVTSCRVTRSNIKKPAQRGAKLYARP